MKRKCKLIVLVAVAFLTMAALIHVNLQNVRGTGPRGVSSMSEAGTRQAGQRSSELNQIDQVES